MGLSTRQDDNIMPAKWTRRNKAANILIIVSGVVLLMGIIFAVHLPERMKEEAVSR